MALNGGKRRTPTVDLGVEGTALVEPSNDTLTGALVELAMLTRDEAYERMGVQNVGDIERAVRATAGAAILGLGALVPRGSRWPLSLARAVRRHDGPPRMVSRLPRCRHDVDRWTWRSSG